MRSPARARSGWLILAWILACSVVIGILMGTAAAQEPASPQPPATGNTGITPDPGTNAPPSAEAQEPDAQDSGAGDGVFVFKKQVEEVVLHASVFDEQRRPVPDLDRSAFVVFDDGSPQPITSFRRQDVPVAMGIVVDNSGSMRDKREQISQAVLNLIHASNSQDAIFVVNFGQEPYLDQDYTSDANLLQAALHQVSARGSTALYDAIVASAVHLEHNPQHLEKKVLLVITDGQDNLSQETLEEAARRLQQADGPVIYSIGLLGSGLKQSGREALQRLADGTGGVAYFPDTLDQVDSITRTVAHDIRTQYVIAYKPHNQNVKPGYQSVRVEAHAVGRGQLTVRTRSGYFPPEPGH